ncbi:MAG: hypothetical protein ACTSRW_04075 [Candidatus Helarchaeota archaeon]
MPYKITKNDLFMIVLIVIVHLSIQIWHVGIEFYKDANAIMLWFAEGNWNYFIYSLEWQFYRPIPLQIMYFIYLVWAWNPVPYHLLGMVLCVANCLLVYVISLEAFKNRFVASIAAIILMLASGFYYQILFWVPCIFYWFYTFFLLLAIYSFIKFHFSETKRWYWFALMAIFSTLSLLSNEAAIFSVVAFPLFELIDGNLKDFFKKKMWKYLAFVPMIVIFLWSHYYTSQQPQYDWYHLPISIGISIAYLPCFLVVYYYSRKQSSLNKFFITLAFFSIFAFILKWHPRTIYLPIIAYCFLFVGLLIKPKYPDILTFFKKDVFTKKFSKLKIRVASGVSIFSTISIMILVINGFLLGCLGLLVGNISNQVIQQVDDPSSHTIYILNAPPLRTLYMTISEGDINKALEVKTGLDYNISNIYVHVNPPVSWRNVGFISIDEYNDLSSNSSNIIFLCNPITFALTNVSGIPYHLIF